jgi:hypothetical protein
MLKKYMVSRFTPRSKPFEENKAKKTLPMKVGSFKGER